MDIARVLSMRHATEIITSIRKDGDFDAAVLRIQDTGTADTDYPITHSLGRTPVGVDLIKKSASCDVYAGSVWNSTVIYVKFTASNADVNIRIW